MSRLKHERVVKLLGVILEDKDYSLVMELIPKGNLQAMLQKVRTLTSLNSKTPDCFQCWSFHSAERTVIASVIPRKLAIFS